MQIVRKKEERKKELKFLTFEPLYERLMTFYNIAFVLSCLECHRHIFIQVSVQLEHFDFFFVSNPFMTP